MGRSLHLSHLGDGRALAEVVAAIAYLDEDAGAIRVFETPRHGDGIAVEAAPPVPDPEPFAVKHGSNDSAVFAQL